MNAKIEIPYIFFEKTKLLESRFVLQNYKSLCPFKKHKFKGIGEINVTYISLFNWSHCQLKQVKQIGKCWHLLGFYSGALSSVCRCFEWDWGVLLALFWHSAIYSYIQLCTANQFAIGSKKSAETREECSISRDILF